MGDQLDSHSKSVTEVLQEWAHRFGPELMVLGFAALVINSFLEEYRQGEVIRQRLVDDLARLLKYAEDNNNFFTQHSILTLDTEAEI